MKKYYIPRKPLIILAVAILTGFILAFVYYKSTSVRPHIIIVVIDALRPDHLGCYGYKRNTSPHIDELTEQSTVFTQAITAGGWTAESVPSILTGTYSFIHGINDWDSRLNSDITTLPQFLKSKGYKSALFTNHSCFSMLDVKDGFDTVEIIEQNDHQLTIEAIDWLERNRAKQFFVYLHYKGPHVPYKLPSSYKNKYLQDRFRDKKEVPVSKDSSYEYEKYEGEGKIPYIVAENGISNVSYYIAQYDGAISYTDTQIGYLMDNLRKLNLLENTFIVLTSDHGEMLGEHDYYFCHWTSYEEILKVPLIIRFPRLFPKGKNISQQVSLTDIAPTVLDILDIKAPSYIQGKTLINLFRKKEASFHPYVYTSSGHETVSIRGEQCKLIRNNIESDYELYNLIEDPQEQHNLISEKQNKFREFKKILLEVYRKESFSSEDQKTGFLTDEQKDDLKSLGYL
ncbi:sulfatase [Candidatus Omnitrophota bacterium]